MSGTRLQAELWLIDPAAQRPDDRLHEIRNVPALLGECPVDTLSEILEL